MTEEERKTLSLAQRFIDEHDANLAVFTVRDMPRLSEELRDMAWVYYQNYVTPREAKELLGLIAEELS